MAIKHKFTSLISDVGIPPGWVKPSNWNDDHDIDGLLSEFDGIALLPNVVPYLDANSEGSTFTISDYMRATMGTVDAAALALALGVAPLNSPIFTGDPRVPTPLSADNDDTIPNTSWVKARIADLVASSPAALDTLNELAASLANDPNFATTMTNALALKAPLASPALTGNPTTPNQSALTNNTRIANTAYADAAVAALSALIIAGTTAVPGAVVGSSLGTYATNADLTALIPADDTVPLISEGTNIITVNYQPKTTTNKLRLTFNGAVSAALPDNVIAAIFAGNTCIAAQMINVTANNAKAAFSLCGEYVPGSITLQSLTVRVGGVTQTVRMNGTAAARLLGGAQQATLLVEEIKA